MKWRWCQRDDGRLEKTQKGLAGMKGEEEREE